MGFKVTFSENFVAELREIVSHISRDNPQAAIELGDALIDEALTLEHFPQRGGTVRGRPGARKLVHGNYLILYEIKGASVEILGCLHGARIK
jgi:toxin ParE1/3/4